MDSEISAIKNPASNSGIYVILLLLVVEYFHWMAGANGFYMLSYRFN
jgi:hypothetical protein